MDFRSNEMRGARERRKKNKMHSSGERSGTQKKKKYHTQF